MLNNRDYNADQKFCHNWAALQISYSNRIIATAVKLQVNSSNLLAV